MNNLYGNPKYKKLIKQLKKKLKVLQIEYKDDMSIADMREMTDMSVKRIYSEEH